MRAIFGSADDAPTEFTIDERQKRPYWREPEPGRFTHKPFTDAWCEHRALAGKICPSVVGKSKDRLGREILQLNAQDIRDTAVTRLMQAECTILQISSWHGSAPKVILDLVQHYIEIGPQQAAEAGEKLIQMCKEQGIST